MDLPTVAGVNFPSSPDFGCMVALQDRILSVGTNKMISLIWSTGTVETVAEWAVSVMETCTYLTDFNGTGPAVVFSSGTYLSLNSLAWNSVSSPPRSFQIAALDNKILMVGEAR